MPRTQRMPGWDTDLHWTPRQGSTIYSGEWEWKYGPAAMTPSDDGVYEWPVQPKYFQTDFPFATEAEVEALSLLKLEIVNLDKDGDGDPNIDDILLTFRFCYPERRGGASSGEVSFDDSFLTYLQTRSEAAIARHPSKLPLNAEEKFLVAKKIAQGTREIRGDPQSSGPIQRKIFAVGRVRPSKINSDKNKVFTNSFNVRDHLACSMPKGICAHALASCACFTVCIQRFTHVCTFSASSASARSKRPAIVRTRICHFRRVKAGARREASIFGSPIFCLIPCFGR